MRSHISHSRGIDILRDPRYYKGTAFTLRERHLLGIHGLLPPAVLTQEEQLERSLINLRRYDDDLSRYIYLISLQDRNEKLFYRLVIENVEYCMPLIYTPTVGLACQKYGVLFRRPRGLFITIHDKDHLDRIFDNWPEQIVKAISVSDGEQVLGYGDLGAYGMGSPVGKLSLFTALAGVQPSVCLPIFLDVGTDNPQLLEDPMYIGLRHRRIRGPQYDQFVDTFMKAVVERYGPNTFIQFEDFANENAFRFLKRYRQSYCTSNDDIQGTAAVALAGIIAACRITNKSISDQIFLFQGAGEAAIGIAHLLLDAMMEEGSGMREAHERIFMVDSKGLLVENRPSGGITGHKEEFMKALPPQEDFLQIVGTVSPSVLIGVSNGNASFSANVLKLMADINEQPIVLAMSNESECTAVEAYTYTQGRGIFASFNKFHPVELNGECYWPGQVNNCYIFPGLALAVVSAGIRPITQDVFLQAAQCLAEQVNEEELSHGMLYPHVSRIRRVSKLIALRVCEYAYRSGCATHYPEPVDKLAFIEKHVFEPHYEDIVPEPYEYPRESQCRR